VARSRELLADEVAKDTRKLFTYDAYLAATSPDPLGEDVSATALRAFAEKRAAFLLSHEAIKELPKKLVSLSQVSFPPSKDRPATASLPRAESSVVLNEIMATGSDSIRDPQGEFEDWIELHNGGTERVDLSGMYLSDDPADPHKWMFPRGAMIAPGDYLVIWADKDVDAKTGLHASFKLSKGGERVTLSSRQAVLAEIEFGNQADGESFGKLGQEYRSLDPTPGAENRAR
jgi:hypothetical protein